MNLNKTKVPKALLLVSFWILLLSIVVIYGSVQKSVIAASANQEIVDKAKSFAWSENDGAKSGSPTSAFSNAAESANLDPDNDCLRFVQTVILSSGVDPDFPKGEYLHNGGVDEYFTVNYMKNSSKWKEISTTNATSLQPGDILVSAVNGIGNNHIFIYLGDNKVASANQGEWYARIGNLSEEWDPNSSSDKEFYYGDNKYQVFRINTLSDSGVSSNQTTSSGLSQQKGLSETLLNKFAQNNILFYNPSDCIDNNPSGLCGNTAKEIYWSALSKYTNDPIKIAGIVGNLANEGGMNPVAWEGGPNYCESAGINSSGELINGWDWYYNGSSTCTGVGAFGLTSGLNKYLHYVNDNAPDLIKYFKNYNEYSYNFLWSPGCGVDSSHPSYGDCLLEKIGADEFGKLVEFEVEYALGDNFKPTTTQEYMGKSFSSPSDAAYWWAQNWEIGEDYLNPKQDRLTDAEKAYDDLKDLDCSFTGESCPKLGELRTKMWTEASQADREDFMYVVEREDYSIAGVEGFMNQIISHHGTNGQLADWLDNQCYEFGGKMSCRGEHAITNGDQDMINEALAGSNHIRFAMGNATGGSSVGAGKIVCVWDGKKCREDVDYNAGGGTGPCSLYSPNEDFGECWGLEGDDEWAEKIKKECGATDTGVSGGTSNISNVAPKTVSGNDITWIGDSYSENSANKAAVEAKYPGIYYNGQSGRMFANDSNRWGASGLNIIGNEIKDDLRDYLVFALGTNTDATSKEDMTKNIDDLVATVKKYNSNTKIILVSPITNNDSTRSIYDAYHKAMQEAVEKYDNVILADWYDAAKDHLDEYFDDHSTGAYTDNSTHPNTKGYGKWIETISNALSSAAGNGCTTYDGEYPQYDQCGDPRWSNYPYSTDNICGSGCGAASMAMLATVATGQDIFPDDIAKLLGNQYYDSVSIATLDPIVGEHYGFDVEVVSTSGAEDAKTKMRDYLKKGYMIHFTGAGCYPGFIYASGGCTNGHVIGLFDIDENDMVTQANSGMGEVHQKASLDDMAHALIWGIFTAIKGGSSGKNGCSNSGLCNTSSNTTVNMDGLTEEQAQKVADYYNNEATASNFIDGVIPSSCAKVNCVSFSYWFVSAFTDASEKGVTSGIIGDGSYIADTGLPGVGWETGNDPTPYSIFGGAGSSAWSHTGVVVGKTDDGNILTIEAAYCQWDARVLTKSPSYFSEGVGILAYPGNHFTPNEGHLGNKSLKEIIGN